MFVCFHGYEMVNKHYDNYNNNNNNMKNTKNSDQVKKKMNTKVS